MANQSYTLQTIPAYPVSGDGIFGFVLFIFSKWVPERWEIPKSTSKLSKITLEQRDQRHPTCYVKFWGIINVHHISGNTIII